MLLLKGISQQLIVINNILLILCDQSNKVIDEGVKNKVMEITNQVEFQIVQQNIDKYVYKQIKENKNDTQQKNKVDNRDRKDENSQDTTKVAIIPGRITAFYERIANQIIDHHLKLVKRRRRK